MPAGICNGPCRRGLYQMLPGVRMQLSRRPTAIAMFRHQDAHAVRNMHVYSRGGEEWAPFAACVYVSKRHFWKRKATLDAGDAAAPYEKESMASVRRGVEIASIGRDNVKVAIACNVFLFIIKVGCYLATNSEAMRAEAVHSLCDIGNSVLLAKGHQVSVSHSKGYAYGNFRALYSYALLSAAGTFFAGGGFSLYLTFSTWYTGAGDGIIGELGVSHVGYETWVVLGCSLLFEGLAAGRALTQLLAQKPEGQPLFRYLRKVKDPLSVAVLVEDSVACVGVLTAAAGIYATTLTGNAMWDSLAGGMVGMMLLSSGVFLANLNLKGLQGPALEPDKEAAIAKLLCSRPAISAVSETRSQYLWPYNFHYKAEVEFNGRVLAERLWEKYSPEFGKTGIPPEELRRTLALYTEDVTRVMELEVKDAERQIRERYAEAAFVDLEPDSKTAQFWALDGARRDETVDTGGGPLLGDGRGEQGDPSEWTPAGIAAPRHSSHEVAMLRRQTQELEEELERLRKLHRLRRDPDKKGR